MIENFNINFRDKRGAYFATFNADTGKMILCTNTEIALLFFGKSVREFILYCRYNEFEFWG